MEKWKDKKSVLVTVCWGPCGAISEEPCRTQLRIILRSDGELEDCSLTPASLAEDLPLGDIKSPVLLDFT